VRDDRSTPFLVAYEHLHVRFGTDYADVRHQHVDAAVLTGFFGPHRFQTRTFRNRQDLDFEGLKGRLLSSSYIPELGHPNYEPMIDELAGIFEDYQTGGHVTLEYLTTLHCGRLEEG